MANNDVLNAVACIDEFLRGIDAANCADEASMLVVARIQRLYEHPCLHRELPTDRKKALLNAYRVSTTVARSIPGDVTSALARAYRAELGEDIASHEDALDDLTKAMQAIPPLCTDAKVHMGRAWSLLASPTLSMDIPLKVGESLPDTVYTLLQGTIWSILMASGASPELDGRGPVSLKLPWFLCRKFLFAHRIAEKDGVVAYRSIRNSFRLYAGRLFTRHEIVGANRATFTRVCAPPTVEIHSDGLANIAVTAKGLYGWGSNDEDVLGLASAVVATPSRIPFHRCPEVDRYERSLPPWGKDRLVLGMHLSFCQSFIHTPVGIVVAGTFQDCFSDGVHAGFTGFLPVLLPPGFVPDTMMVSYGMLLVLRQPAVHRRTQRLWPARH
ncbi:hypothetical protein J8273_8141 [Carpediemonas membranifera]|uniref:Uncharacterized protein n=1 Tax=Carpediemonas membranifera TaxID=201153 RepID=A0A8J6B060_9EUKA|nr:hypothetical protein J8273_8141 [Carpediemonas membranifera]|eukprot:KAG9390104.1 hypothetical protein J8273_8141 [Carpediemonas membranifera]